MIEALRAHSISQTSMSVPISNEEQTSKSEQVSQDGVVSDFSTDMAGSAFDALLNSLKDEESSEEANLAGNTGAENC